MSISVHQMRESDIEATNGVIKAAYNNPHGREETLRRYLQLQPDGVYVAKEGGQIVGFGGTINYGAFAYIGLMSVHPSMQRQGVGQIILSHLLDWLDMHECPTVLLDATPVGRPLYEHSGFIEEDITIVLRQTVRMPLPRDLPDDVRVLSGDGFPELMAFDRPFFGAERGALLASYRSDDLQRVFVARDANGQMTGYLIAQPFVLGPWVARTAEAAERLLMHALALPFTRDLNVFVSAQNADALCLLTRNGFSQHRTLSHMSKGKPIQRGRATALYGQTSLGFG